MRPSITFHPAPVPTVKPGTLPARYLEQAERWVDTGGFEHEIASMELEPVLYYLDYILANARQIRDAWSAELRETYDEEQRARRWMLERPVTLAFIRRLLVLKNESVPLPTPSAHTAALRRIADGPSPEEVFATPPRTSWHSAVALEALND